MSGRDRVVKVPEPACPVCGGPIRDNAYLCGECTRKLAEALGQIVDLYGELDTTLAYQARLESANNAPPAMDEDWPPDAKPGASVQPLVFDARASDVADALTRVVHGWASAIVAERGIQLPPVPGPPIGPVHVTDCPHLSCDLIRWHVQDPVLVHATKFVAAHLWWLRRRPEAGDAYAGLTRVAADLEHVIDAPAARTYAGPCDVCRTDLYVTQGAGIVQCRGCAMTYDVAGRREHLLEAAEDRLERAAHIAAAVTDLGSPISADRIRVWAARKRLIARATDGLGHCLYRVGDVLDLLAQDTRHAAAG